MHRYTVYIEEVQEGEGGGALNYEPLSYSSLVKFSPKNFSSERLNFSL